MSAIPGNPHNRSTYQRRSDSPRKVRGGIKLAGTLLERETEATTNAAIELARRFQSLWEAAFDHEALEPGLEYAKLGQVVDLEFRSGVIESHVQGTLAKPYLVQLLIPVLSEGQWQEAISAMAAEAVYVAKLLAGELPAAIHDRLKEAGIELLPSSPETVSATCTCAAALGQRGRSMVRCKHVAAAALVAAERLAEHPLLIFTLLGKSPEHVLEHLRQARAGRAAKHAASTQDLILSDSSFHAPPLEACVDEFWRSPVRSEEWNQLLAGAGSHYVPHALLRRLGPSPLNGKFPLVGLLASVYDAVAAAARRLEKVGDGEGISDTDPTR